MKRILDDVQLGAVRTVGGLLAKPGDENYNPDADKTWKEATVRTRAALILTQGSMAAERAKTQAQAGPRTLGVVVVAPRVESAAKWEELAAAVDAGRPILDVEAVPVQEENRRIDTVIDVSIPDGNKTGEDEK